MQHGNIGYLWYSIQLVYVTVSTVVPFRSLSFQPGWDFATVSVNRAEYVTRLFEMIGNEVSIQGSLVEQDPWGFGVD